MVVVAGWPPPAGPSHANETAAAVSANEGGDPFAGLSSLAEIEGMASTIGKQLDLEPFPLAKMLLKAVVRERDGQARYLYRSEIENIVRRALGVQRGRALSGTQRALSLEPNNPARLGRKRPIARALSSDLVAGIHALRKQGLANAAIAKQIGCDPRTVRKALRRFNATSAVAPLAWRNQGPTLEVCSAFGFDAYVVGADGRWTWFLADSGQVIDLGAAQRADRAKEAATRALRAAARPKRGDGLLREKLPWACGLQWRTGQDERGSFWLSSRARGHLLKASWEGTGWEWVIDREPGRDGTVPVAKGKATTFKVASTRLLELSSR